VHLPGLRSGLLVAWGSAFLAGRAPLAAAAAALSGPDEEAVTAPDGRGMERLLAALRADGATRLELVLPVPGDVRGVPAGGAFPAAALDAGEAVLTRGCAQRAGLVPAVAVCGPPGDTFTVCTWTRYDVAEPDLLAPPLLTVAEAEADLRETLAASTRELTRLEVGRWRPGLDAPLAELRASARRGDGPAGQLPEGYPPRARALLAQADTLARVLELAGAGPDSAWHGGAVSTSEVQARAAALRPLAQALRRARLAAYNGFSEVARAG